MPADIEDAISGLMPEPMQPEDYAHVHRVVASHSELTLSKYVAGKEAHQGQCWKKPGMLAHALDESADLPVYLWTLREQMRVLISKLRNGEIESLAAADEIERWLTK